MSCFCRYDALQQCCIWCRVNTEEQQHHLTQLTVAAWGNMTNGWCQLHYMCSQPCMTTGASLQVWCVAVLSQC